MRLVIQLRYVVMVLDIHEAAEGVRDSIKDGEDRQRRSYEIHLKDCSHHGSRGTGTCTKKNTDTIIDRYYYR